ncbi:MAG TPA: NAD(P)H-binding protein [Burkholderiales bacterium]|nr:NAD(P)H-binding protein [Burkholderiales bacterium]
MKVLLLGGAGFLGRHAAAVLAARGHTVVIGSRHPARAPRRLPAGLLECERREARLERLLSPDAWGALLVGVDTVVNAVGILRERGAETYDRVHRLAPAALAAACARRAIRLVHISCPGLYAEAPSRFLTSKLSGERAIAACGSNYSIVRPSLLDGDGGFGALWFRRVARWPVHPVPAGTRACIAAFDVRELGEAVAALCEKRDARDWREVELGGREVLTIAGYLAALRPGHLRPALKVTVPAWLSRVVSHLCDLIHFSPYSFGHLLVLRRDFAPQHNRLTELLGREPRPIGRLHGIADDRSRPLSRLRRAE